MDPTPAEGSARQTRRKHYRKKTGKNATQKSGFILPPRHPQLKRQSQRAPNQQGSEQVVFLGSGSGPARQEPQRRNRRQGRRPPVVTYGPGASALSLTPRFSTPGSVPPAPLNSTRLALAESRNPLATPAQAAPRSTTSGSGEAALNFYGSNEGLIVKAPQAHHGHTSDLSGSESEGGSSPDTAKESGDDIASFQLKRREPTGHAILKAEAEETVKKQQAHIDELEDENQRLKERLDLLTTELRDLRRAAQQAIS